jgi:MFS family permease
LESTIEPSSPAARTDSSAGPFAPLRFRDFRLLWIGMVVASTTQPIQFFAQAWLVISHADSDIRILLLGVLGAIRGSAMLAFGLFGGALADRWDRRHLLMMTQSLSFVLTGVTGVTMLLEPFSGYSLLAFAFTLFFFQTAAQAIDLPTRQALVPRLVPSEFLQKAIALMTMAMQFSMPVSIFLAGALVDALGVGGGYLVSLLGYAAVLIALLLQRSDAKAHLLATTTRVSVLRNVTEGLAYAKGHKTVVGVILVILTMNGLAMPVVNALGPVWFNQVLGLGPAAMGRIVTFWGVGSILASFGMASVSGRFHGPMFFATAAAFGFAIFTLGMTRWLPGAALAYFSLGLLMVLTQVNGTTILQSVVSNQYMGRVMSLMLLGQGISQLGALPLGVLAQAAGLENAVPALGLTSLGVVVILALMLPAVRRLDRLAPSVRVAAS